MKGDEKEKCVLELFKVRKPKSWMNKMPAEN